MVDVDNSIPMKWLKMYKKIGQAFWDKADARFSSNAPWVKEGCYCPVNMALEYILGNSPVIRENDYRVALSLAILASWRKAKSIYSFDKDLADTLREQAKDDLDVTSDMLKLPAWCIYIDLPGSEDMDGMFVMYDVGNDEKYLCMVPMKVNERKAVCSTNPYFLRIPKEPTKLSTLIDWFLEKQHQVKGTANTGDYEVKDGLKTFYQFVISMLLYLSAVNRDVVFKNEATYKEPWKITDRAREVKVFSVGEETGMRLRTFHKDRVEYEEKHEKHHASPVMHIRRAHWHTYLYGKGKMMRRIKWQGPIIVKNNGEEIDVVTLTTVKKENKE